MLVGMCVTWLHSGAMTGSTQTGFNAMFGHQFGKLYHHQHGICAEVIRHLRLNGNPSETNDLVYTICTN